MMTREEVKTKATRIRIFAACLIASVALASLSGCRFMTNGGNPDIKLSSDTSIATSLDSTFTTTTTTETETETTNTTEDTTTTTSTTKTTTDTTSTTISNTTDTTSTTTKDTTKTTTKPTTTSTTKVTTNPTTKQTTATTQGETHSFVYQVDESLMYGYSKLTGSEKKLYNTLLNGISSHKSSITITASSTDSVLRAYYAIIGDHPEIFYITGKLVFKGSKTLVSTVEVEYAYTASQTEQMNKEIEAVASAILSKISVNASSFEKLKIIHDSIILGCDYSYTGSNLHNLYGALVEGKSVCEGYAEAFQYLAQRVGVMTLAVTGDVGVEGHMWNMVRLENEFYHIDPTHDDPTGSEKDYIQYDYFNLTTAEILQTRTISPYYDSATKSWLNYYEIPNSTATKYNYFNYKGLNFSSYDSVAAQGLQNEISNAVLAGRHNVFIRFSSADAYTAAFNSLNKNGEVFTLIDNATADMPMFSLKGVYTSGEQSDFNIMWIYLNY